MQHTTNYNLPQWEDTDAVKREDVNAAMSAIDAAIKAADTESSEKLHVELLTYTGTGTYGPYNPTHYQFSGAPAVFFMFGGDMWGIGMLSGGGTGMAYSFLFQSSNFVPEMCDLPLGVYSHNLILFSSASTAKRQFNAQDVDYIVIGLCR